MDITSEVNIIKYSGGKSMSRTDVVTVEYFLDIVANGHHFSSLNCTPRELSELVKGHLLCEGKISCIDDILSLSLDEEKGRANITLGEIKNISPPDVFGLSPVFSPQALFTNLNEFYSSSELFYSTGAVHKSALYTDGGLVADAVDISRHNTVDKLIGKAMENNIALGECYLIISGRVHLEIVRKVLRAGIPMLVSRSAPSREALNEAVAHGLTLLGFARENRFNVYSKESRIDLSEIVSI